MKVLSVLISLFLLAGIGFAADANKIVCDGSTTVGPIAKAFAEFYMKQNPGVNITVSESGSGNGAKSIVNKSCDVANMSRLLKLGEYEAAVHSEVLPVVHVVALDGIAMIVHPSNPLTKLTMAQIKDLYLGKIKNWSQLGGPNAPVVIISRDTNSGTYETFEGKVMKKEKIASSCEYVGSNGAIRQRVQSTTTAIGYVGIGFIDNTVKALPVEGVNPSAETVKNGSYPIARPLYMITNNYPKMGSHLYRFVTLYLSKKGQAMIEEIGFIPVTSY